MLEWFRKQDGSGNSNREPNDSDAIVAQPDVGQGNVNPSDPELSEGTAASSGATGERLLEPTEVATPTATPEGAVAGAAVTDSEAPAPQTVPEVDEWPEPEECLPEPRVPPMLAGRRKGRALRKSEDVPRAPLTPEQRLWVLDTWKRSGLPAADFAPLVGLSRHTLYTWKKKFAEQGPAGLLEQARGARAGSRLPELTKRSILLMKEAHPEWGVERLSDMLARGPALPASPSAVARVLHEAGYQMDEVPTRPHPDKVRHFERARPNQLWQTDLFTFVLKRQNRRVYLVAFMDDHSRYIVSYGLHASQSTALVLEVLRAGIACYGAPEEILTDNGAQYVTWRGKSQFTKELEKQGIRQIVAAPRRPQTLGKIERFWGTLWRECVETAVFVDLADARTRIGLFMDGYNFRRTHSGIDGLVPADRFFGAAPEVLRTLKERVAANALELARQGLPKAPFYVTGNVAGKGFSVHAEGERVILTREGGQRQEVDLVPPPEAAGPSSAAPLPQPVCPDGSPGEDLPAGAEQGPSPGLSGLDDALRGDAP
jgi:transposase InsO family protein